MPLGCCNLCQYCLNVRSLECGSIFSFSWCISHPKGVQVNCTGVDSSHSLQELTNSSGFYHPCQHDSSLASFFFANPSVVSLQLGQLSPICHFPGYPSLIWFSQVWSQLQQQTLWHVSQQKNHQPCL